MNTTESRTVAAHAHRNVRRTIAVCAIGLFTLGGLATCSASTSDGKASAESTTTVGTQSSDDGADSSGAEGDGAETDSAGSNDAGGDSTDSEARGSNSGDSGGAGSNSSSGPGSNSGNNSGGSNSAGSSGSGSNSSGSNGSGGSGSGGNSAGSSGTGSGHASGGEAGNGNSATVATEPKFTKTYYPPNIDCHNGYDQTFSASWTTVNTTKVTVSIDGKGVYKTYGPNAKASLPFNCKRAHTFVFTAYGSYGKYTTKSITLQPRNTPSATAPVRSTTTMP